MCYSNMSTRWPQKVLKSRKIAVDVAVAVWATFMSNNDEKWYLSFLIVKYCQFSIGYILIYGHLNCKWIRYYFAHK